VRNPFNQSVLGDANKLSPLFVLNTDDKNRYLNWNLLKMLEFATPPFNPHQDNLCSKQAHASH